MATLLLLIAADVATGDPTWLGTLGPFVAYGGLSMLVMVWLARQLVEANKTNRDLSDRMVVQAERVGQVLEHNSVVIEAALRALEGRP